MENKHPFLSHLHFAHAHKDKNICLNVKFILHLVVYIIQYNLIMKTKYLLPSRFKKIGWFLLLPCLALGVPTVINEWSPRFLEFDVFALFIDGFPNDKRLFGFIQNNVLNELLGILIIISGLIVAFSRESDEDELISKMRLESLVWTIYWNYGILILALLFVYDFSFYWVMMFNMFTPLLLFIARFNWVVRKFRKSAVYEEQH